MSGKVPTEMEQLVPLRKAVDKTDLYSYEDGNIPAGTMDFPSAIQLVRELNKLGFFITKVVDNGDGF